MLTNEETTNGFVSIGFSDGTEVYEVRTEDLYNALKSFRNLSKL